ncbi:CehA/McbA family metallohydrolase [Endozoicomonas sp. ALC020]|uniref:CehA/McbA family metallohydrolase n=1 Tax=unclassified Endozoicomonas TaxID=2644528 RepID=UPI003BAE5214
MTEFQGELTFGRTRLPFKVPNGTLSVNITGSTVTKRFLYAAVYDAKDQYRGKILFEKPDKSLCVKPERSGFGAIDGDVMEGEWYLDLYNLDAEFKPKHAIEYRIRVDFNQEQKHEDLLTEDVVGTDHNIHFDYSRLIKSESRWYRGDLHAHTRLSDGHNSLSAAKQIVESQELDFFFFTEHNICQPRLPVSDSCLFLPGIEVTTDLGHFNVHGPQSILDLRSVELSNQKVIETGLQLAREGQSSISINHPMMKPWHWQYSPLLLVKISTFEVCCDPTWPTSPQATESALRVLNEMWNCGHRVAAIGGSDSHLEPHERNPKATEPSIYGDPSTFVFSQGLSGEGILSGLRNGQVYIERRCGLSFDINNHQLLPGADSSGEPLSYRIAVQDTQLSYLAECIVDGELVATVMLGTEPKTIKVDSDYYWCRVDIRKARTREFEGCINAVYNGTKPTFKTPKVHSWGELIERLNSDEV